MKHSQLYAYSNATSKKATHNYIFQLTQGKEGVAISDIVLECSHSDYSLMFPFMLHCNYIPNTLHGTYTLLC